MSPLVCLQWALCCLPVMACEISIIIIMAPRAAMSADGRSLIGNELSHHPTGTCLLLCYLELYVHNFASWHICWLSECEDKEADLEEGKDRHRSPMPIPDHHHVIGADAKSHNSSRGVTANPKCHPRISLHADILSVALPWLCSFAKQKYHQGQSSVSMTHLHLPFETHHILLSGLRALQPAHLHLLPIILSNIFSACVCVCSLY